MKDKILEIIEHKENCTSFIDTGFLRICNCGLEQRVDKIMEAFLTEVEGIIKKERKQIGQGISLLKMEKYADGREFNKGFQEGIDRVLELFEGELK